MEINIVRKHMVATRTVIGIPPGAEGFVNGATRTIMMMGNGQLEILREPGKTPVVTGPLSLFKYYMEDLYAAMDDGWSHPNWRSVM